MKRRTSLDAIDANMNLTPLIDVVFVILVMFIVMAPLLDIDRIELASHSPSINEKGVLEKSPFYITVFADDSLKINNHCIDIQELPKYCAYAKKKFPDARPQLFYDKKGSFGTYQKIKNVLEETGFRELDIILKPN